MSDTKAFNVRDVVVSFLGVPIDSGYADGDFVAIKKTTADNTSKVGADGEVGIAPTNDGRATISIKLLHTSSGHPKLGAIRSQGLALGRPLVGALEIKDLGGSLLWHAPHAWIQKPPDPSFGKEIGEWEWTLESSDGDYDFPGVLPL